MKRVLVVRSGQTPFVSARRPLGVEVVEKVSHRIEPALSGHEALEEPAQLAIFTSRTTVARLFEEKGLPERLSRALSGGRVAAVGGRTADALRLGGIEPAIIAAGSARSVLERLPQVLDGWRVLLPGGEDASEELSEGLLRRGATVARLLLYRKLFRPPDRELPAEILERPFRAFCVTSSAAGRWLFDTLPAEAAEALIELPAVVLGPSAGRFLAERGVLRVEVAGEATFASAGRVLESLAGAEPSA